MSDLLKLNWTVISNFLGHLWSGLFLVWFLHHFPLSRCLWWMSRQTYSSISVSFRARRDPDNDTHGASEGHPQFLPYNFPLSSCTSAHFYIYAAFPFVLSSSVLLSANWIEISLDYTVWAPAFHQAIDLTRNCSSWSIVSILTSDIIWWKVSMTTAQKRWLYYFHVAMMSGPLASYL